MADLAKTEKANARLAAFREELANKKEWIRRIGSELREANNPAVRAGADGLGGLLGWGAVKGIDWLTKQVPQAQKNLKVWQAGAKTVIGGGAYAIQALMPVRGVQSFEHQTARTASVVATFFGIDAAVTQFANWWITRPKSSPPAAGNNPQLPQQ